MTTASRAAAEAAVVRRVVCEIAAACPRRAAGSDGERRAHRRIAAELDTLGVAHHEEPFRFTGNLYTTMALHFGVCVAGAAIAGRRPWLGGALRALGAVSWGLDASRRAHILRRLQPTVASQNLVATIPAARAALRRVVLVAHVDAAFTGLIFRPQVLRAANAGRTGDTQPYTAHSMELATDAELLGTALSWTRAAIGKGRGASALRRAEIAAAVPALVVAALNAEIAIRREQVTGAADNLSGVAALLVLAARFVEAPLDDTEVVLVFSGAEEAGTGGAQRLLESRRGVWSPRDTVVLAVDTVCNGALRWFAEGEVVRQPIDFALEALLRDVASSDPRFAGVRRMQIPVGASDAMPFAAAGFPAVGIGCFDPEYGAPRHYHHPNDTVANAAFDEVALAVEFVERVVRHAAAALPPAPAR